MGECKGGGRGGSEQKKDAMRFKLIRFQSIVNTR